MIAREKLAVALDGSDRRKLLDTAQRLAGEVGMLKVGAAAFTAFGPEFVREILGLKVPVFLDLKLHDIPNTVELAAAAAAGLGVSLVTVHASGGADMVRAAARAVEGSATRVVAVTVLTHLGAADLEAIGWTRPLDDQVVALARLAREAGADGVVSAPPEVRRLRAALGKEALLVVPGIRPSWAAADEQRRAETPADAIAAGADYLVVGRPILQAMDPVAAARRILAE